MTKASRRFGLRWRGDREQRALVVVPVYGNHEMTHALLGDLGREAQVADVVIVDNRGDYPALGGEDVLRPGSNLRWAGGTNHGTQERLRADHVGAVWLNNDTRLAAGCIAGLLACWRATGAGVVGPFYDCHWEHQRLHPPVPVERYRARAAHFRVPFLDGTCMFVPTSTMRSIGLLDADTFAPVGWGAEIDYGLRARAARLQVAVTALSYLHHEKSASVSTAFEGGLREYGEVGYPAMVEGLEHNWGPQWRRHAGLDPVQIQTFPLLRKDRIGPMRRRRPPHAVPRPAAQAP